MSDLQDQAIQQHCKALRLPTVGSQFRRLAETAIREQQSHPGYLEALLAAEMEARESRAIARLLHDPNAIDVVRFVLSLPFAEAGFTRRRRPRDARLS